MDRAIEFYSGVLGLELLRREGNDWAELRARGHGDRALGRARDAPPPGRGDGHPAHRRHRGGRAAARRATACSAAAIEDMGGAKMLQFFDPDGNEIVAHAAGPAYGPRRAPPGRRRAAGPAAMAVDEALDVLGPDRDARGRPAERRAHPQRLGQLQHAPASPGAADEGHQAARDARPDAAPPGPAHRARRGRSAPPGCRPGPASPMRTRHPSPSTVAVGRPGASGHEEGRRPAAAPDREASAPPPKGTRAGGRIIDGRAATEGTGGATLVRAGSGADDADGPDALRAGPASTSCSSRSLIAARRGRHPGAGHRRRASPLAQIFFGDKIALASMGARVTEPEEAPGAARDDRAPLPARRPAQAQGRDRRRTTSPTPSPPATAARPRRCASPPA